MDSLVQGTNDSSILSKYSMVKQGYFEDKAIHNFVSKGSRRSPLIHLGYFVRALVMDQCIKTFIKRSLEAVQILSLGAGFDTTFFRLREEFPELIYFEVDLMDVVQHKITSIVNSTELLSILGENYSVGNEFLVSRNYNIFFHDLSNVIGLKEKLLKHGFNFSQPTLIYSECAITYIEEERSTNLIGWLAEEIKLGTLMNYEQFNPDDGFGRVMCSHFDKIQSPLRSLRKYKTMDEQRARYLIAGWTHSQVYSVMDLFHQFTTMAEKKRVFRMEPFDEWEEFHLKCCHYSLAVASHNRIFTSMFGLESSTKSRRDLTAKTARMTFVKELEVRRYGHSVVPLKGGGVLVLGGFGVLSGNRHGRVKNVTFVGRRNALVEMKEESPSIDWDSMYHTSTLVGESEFVVYGGRTSPTRATNVTPNFVKFADIGNRVTLETTNILTVGPQPSPRWRHAATAIGGSLWIFGGRNEQLEVLDDLWELTAAKNSGEWKWIQRTVDQSKRPSGRFSHAMTSSQESIYLVGGLDPSFNPLSDVWKLSVNAENISWEEIRPAQQLQPVYGHSVHCQGDRLILVGGVNTSATHQPHLSILNLTTLHVTSFSFELECNPLVMLHNFSSVLDEEEEAIYCYGGGGNCFSFGTHFNLLVSRISIKELLL